VTVILNTLSLKTNLNGNITLTGNLQVNRSLNVLNSAIILGSLNTGLIRASGDVIITGRSSNAPHYYSLQSIGNVLLSSNLNLLQDASFNGKLFIGGGITGGSTTVGSLSVLELNVGSGDITLNNLSTTLVQLNPSSQQTGNINVSGTITSNNLITGVSFNATSDYRIKSNVSILNNNYTVDNLKPVVYFNKLKQSQDIGFIANEVQDEFPFLVDGIKDQVNGYGEPIYQSLNYQGIIPILVKEIQNLKRELNLIKQQ
jgi:hypothetical protein